MCQFAFSNDAFRFTAQDAHALAKGVAVSTVRLVRLTGGEPLMLPDLADIGREFIQTGHVAFSVITNGYLIVERMDSLRAAGVAQVVISIDGLAESHDRFRRLPGLFQRCYEGIQAIRRSLPEVVVRVNTVVGQHNIAELTALYDSLCSWGVDQWSIIPLKRDDGAWIGFDEANLKGAYDQFRAHAMSRPGRLRLLGHSLNWAGRDADEFRRFWEGRQPMTPRGECRLVDLVRYYTPKSGLVFPCNCVPHRSGNVEFGEPRTDSSLTPFGLTSERDWLRENGPATCRGCEPVNAALGEGAVDLDHDLLGF